MVYYPAYFFILHNHLIRINLYNIYLGFLYIFMYVKMAQSVALVWITNLKRLNSVSNSISLPLLSYTHVEKGFQYLKKSPTEPDQFSKDSANDALSGFLIPSSCGFNKCQLAFN